MHKLIEQMIQISDERGMKSPEGLTYGVRSVRHDLTSRHGFRWSFPGKWSKAEGPFDADNRGGCPSYLGDGICVANDWQGMASGSIPALSLLLIGYRESDVLGSESNGSKLRVKRAFVRDLFDGQALLLTAGGADLYGANLYGADLHSANLYGANLRSANLCGANLRSANLYGADLRSADLYGANLRSADLRSANLRSTNLYGANLYGADLRSADLCSVDLRSANLYGANLYGANLRSVDLYGALNTDKAYGLPTPEGTK